MNEPWENFSPSWLQTAAPFGGHGGLLNSLTRPADEPWNDPRPMIFAQTPWGSMPPPPSLFGLSPTFPPAPPPSSWASSSASLWHTPLGANAGFSAPPAQPVLEPWNDPRSAIFAQTPWVPMTPPPSLVGLSPTFPLAPPSSSWDPSSASLWHTPFGANATFPAPSAQPVASSSAPPAPSSAPSNGSGDRSNSYWWQSVANAPPGGNAGMAAPTPQPNYPWDKSVPSWRHSAMPLRANAGFPVPPIDDDPFTRAAFRNSAISEARGWPPRRRGNALSGDIPAPRGKRVGRSGYAARSRSDPDARGVASHRRGRMADQWPACCRNRGRPGVARRSATAQRLGSGDGAEYAGPGAHSRRCTSRSHRNLRRSKGRRKAHARWIASRSRSQNSHDRSRGASHSRGAPACRRSQGRRRILTQCMDPGSGRHAEKGNTRYRGDARSHRSGQFPR